MENKEALSMLEQAINYGENDHTVKGNWMLGTPEINAVRLAIKALKKEEKIRIDKELKEEKLAAAVVVLISALEEDKTPGSYYFGWQSNLACSISDNSQLNMDQANHIARHFLNRLIDSGNGNV